jgi:hypothetical protein
MGRRVEITEEQLRKETNIHGEKQTLGSKTGKLET